MVRLCVRMRSFVYVFKCLIVDLFVRVCGRLFVCLIARLCECLFVCLFVCYLCGWLSVRFVLLVCLFELCVRLLVVCFVCLFACLFGRFIVWSFDCLFCCQLVCCSHALVICFAFRSSFFRLLVCVLVLHALVLVC